MRYDFRVLFWPALLAVILLGWFTDRTYQSAQLQELRRVNDHLVADLDKVSPQWSANNQRLLNRFYAANSASPWTAYLIAGTLFVIVGGVLWGVVKGKLHPSILEIGRRK